MHFRLALLPAAVLVLGCHDKAPPVLTPGSAAKPVPEPPARVTLVFTASKAGMLVPCGCSPDQRGGLPREAALLKKIRAQDPSALFVDAGDLLFESPSPPGAQIRRQKELKARTLAKGDEMLGAAARAVGMRDLALGAAFARETAGNVPLLDAGAAPVSGARASLIARAGEVPIGLFAAGLGEEPDKTIAARAADLRAQGARIVVLLLHPRGDNALNAAAALLPGARAAGVDLVVLGRRDDPTVDPNRKEPGPPPSLAVEGDGQSVVRVDVALGQGPLVLAPSEDDRKDELKALDARMERFRAQAKQNPDRASQILAKVKELEDRRAALANAPPGTAPAGATVARATFIPLEKSVGEDPDAQQLVAAYDRQVAEMNLADAQKQPPNCPPPRRGELAYVGITGPNGCADCHADAVKFWTKTKHAHAYETLVRVEKQFSLDCIRCHVTGWQQPGGVCRIDRTHVGGPGVRGMGVGRRDVQCESCHGPGSAHAADPSTSMPKVTEATCVRCHEPANSPHFDHPKYLPWVVGPGHGDKLARGEEPRPRGEVLKERAR